MEKKRKERKTKNPKGKESAEVMSLNVYKAVTNVTQVIL